nr:unnamed protein product [uncultured bacterium]
MSNKKEKSINITFRMPLSVVAKLDDLCSLYNLKRSEFFNSLVVSEYDKVQGSPELFALLEQFKNLTDKIQSLKGD